VVGIDEAEGVAMSESAIEARSVQRVYGSTRALIDASLVVAPGEIHALLGENGAGKSTLVRILAGLEHPDGGSVTVFGTPMSRASVADRTDRGISVIHQDLGLVEALSVADNIALGARYPTRFGLVSGERVRQQARDALTLLEIELDVDRPVAELPPTEQAIVAIARALRVGARLIVLDEPTARLHAGEVRVLFARLDRLRKAGVACLLITHRIDDVLKVCDRVTVMRDGRSVGMRDAKALDRDELVSLIVGRETTKTHSPTRTRPAPGAAVLDVRELGGFGFGPVSLSVGEGEIVGVTGLADAGHHQVALSISGALPAAHGSIEVDGVSCVFGSERDAIRRGVRYVPADRLVDGLAPNMTAAENLFLAGPQRGVWVRQGKERRATREALEQFGVRPPEPDREINTFSGGNQQKVLLARSFLHSPRVLVLHEPTAAVDIGARYDIYELLRRRCVEDHCGGLVVTSDLEEAASLCDRVFVMRAGRVVAELSGDDLELETITQLAYGGTI
jgi:ribose transport system ATP-binding protein